MIVLSNTEAQTLAPGASLTFNDVIIKSGGAECHRSNTDSVKLRSTGVYAASFSGNIGGTAAGAVQISMQLGGATLPETTMISTTAAAGDLNNVSTETRVKICCGDFDRLTIVNTGTTELTVGANTALVVNRVA